jgi:ribonuclease HII
MPSGDGFESHEETVRRRGYLFPAGVDEVGRGPLAGPVVAAAVILPPGAVIPGIRDSKQLSPSRRERLDPIIRSIAVAVSIAAVEADEIDRINILRATHRAMALAIAGLSRAADFVLVDGRPVSSITLPNVALVGGDRRCVSIAAASIVAKVHRDRLMDDLHRCYPGYGFDRHKGYGTREHLRAIGLLGPCPQHRRTFGGVREHVQDP